MSYGLTPRQMELLRFVRSYQLAHDGISPSLSECAAGIGIVTKSGALRLLDEMEVRGVIRRLHNRARAIDVLVPDRAVAVSMIGDTPLYAVPGPWSARP